MTIPETVIANNRNLYTTDANGETTVNEHDDDVTTFNATEIAGDDFDLLGALMAIAHGDAEFKSTDAEGQAVIDGMEHAFQAGALFAHLFGEEVAENPELIHMGFQTYMLAQLALVGQDSE